MFTFRDLRNCALQNLSYLLPFRPSKVSQVAHLSHNLGTCVERLPFLKRAAQKVEILNRVLSRPLEKLNATPVDCSYRVKYQKVSIDE